MSRTLVFFSLPPNQLVYLELENLAGKPVEGNFLVLEGVRYRVVDVTESIGEVKADGSFTPRSGLEKLLEVLAVLFNDNAMNMLSGLRNIGSGDQPKATGGIFLPNKSLVGDFDHAVVVRLKAHGGKTAVNDLLGQLLKAHSATDAPTTAHENVGNHSTSPAAPPIIVGEDAASEQ